MLLHTSQLFYDYITHVYITHVCCEKKLVCAALTSVMSELSSYIFGDNL